MFCLQWKGRVYGKHFIFLDRESFVCPKERLLMQCGCVRAHGRAPLVRL
jgi:hypothetical protein